MDKEEKIKRLENRIEKLQGRREKIADDLTDIDVLIMDLEDKLDALYEEEEKNKQNENL